MFQLQCQACGASVGSARTGEAVAVDPRTVPWWNRRVARRPRPTARKRAYAARFKRPDWKKLRAQVLERDRWTCQRRGCEERATTVHHRTYERFGAERLVDLEARCQEHNLEEREQRVTRRVLG